VIALSAARSARCTLARFRHAAEASNPIGARLPGRIPLQKPPASTSHASIPSIAFCPMAFPLPSVMKNRPCAHQLSSGEGRAVELATRSLWNMHIP